MQCYCACFFVIAVEHFDRFAWDLIWISCLLKFRQARVKFFRQFLMDLKHKTSSKYVKYLWKWNIRFHSFYKLCAKHVKNWRREIIINPFIAQLILRKIRGGWQRGGEVETQRNYNSCKWGMYFPLVTKGLFTVNMNICLDGIVMRKQAVRSSWGNMSD